jgi:hypothetical protein
VRNPGNALGKTGVRQENEDFTILHASVYSVVGGAAPIC